MRTGSAYGSFEEHDERPSWKRCNCDETNYEYYDCKEVVIHDPTPEEIRAGRIDGLNRFYNDRVNVTKPFDMLLIRGHFPHVSAGIGGIWFPALRRRLPGGAPDLNPGARHGQCPYVADIPKL